MEVVVDATLEDEVKGRLELYRGGDWTSICERSFGVPDATVACRQLGYHDKGKEASICDT